MLSDKLQLNDGMTEFVVIGTRKQLVKFSSDGSRVGDCVVFPSSVVEDLGCWLDGQLKMNEHIKKVCKASFFHLCNIQRIRKFLSSYCTQILVNAFVTGRRDYCNSLLFGLPDNQLHKLQRVQNAAARLICNVVLHYLVFIGYLLPIESSLKSFSLLLKQFLALPRNIFQNF